MQKGPLLSNVSLPLCCIVSGIMMEMMRWTIALYSAALANCSLGHSLLSPLSFPRCHLAPRPASTSSTMQQGCLHCIDISPAVTCMLIDTFNVSGKVNGIYFINACVAPLTLSPAPSVSAEQVLTRIQQRTIRYYE